VAFAGPSAFIADALLGQSGGGKLNGVASAVSLKSSLCVSGSRRPLVLVHGPTGRDGHSSPDHRPNLDHERSRAGTLTLSRKLHTRNLCILPLAYFQKLGAAELMILAFGSLLIFGYRLPSVIRSLGKSVNQFKNGGGNGNPPSAIA
jgi:sec-independent protein translocase protein TatA